MKIVYKLVNLYGNGTKNLQTMDDTDRTPKYMGKHVICRHAHIVHENSNSDLNLKHMCRRRLCIYSVTQPNKELINRCNVKQGQHTELPRNREKTDIRYRKTINDRISAILVVLSCRCSIRSGLFLKYNIVNCFLRRT